MDNYQLMAAPMTARAAIDLKITQLAHDDIIKLFWQSFVSG
jgi:hypothetical protein